MSRSALILLVVCLALTGAVPPVHARGTTASTNDGPLSIIVDPRTVLTSTTTTSELMLRRESAGPDTFDLYGGPRRLVRDPDGVPGSGDEYVEGKFEDPSGVNPRGLSPNSGDWTGVDVTDFPIHWAVDTFNAANLNANGTGNRAMWCGAAVDDPRTEGWAFAPGYGPGWTDDLLFESDPVSSPSVGQTVDLDFVFNVDTEPGYDYFTVAYDSAGTWTEVWSFSGSNRDAVSGEFEAPGWRFADRPDARPIVFAGGDYGEDDRIRVRLRFESDHAWDDHDVLDTDGAVQLDDVTLTTRDGTFTEDFEGPGPFLFEAVKRPFAGDFSHVFFRATDPDPCRENRTPQANFVDFGQEPPNGPGASGRASTGGTRPLDPDPGYGSLDYFVVNHTGGLDGVPLHNEIWSPPIAWDLPGTDDDGADVQGAVFGFTVFRDNPQANGIFFYRSVRDRVDGQWGPWRDDNFVFFSSTPNYLRSEFAVGHLLRPDPEALQVRLGVVDLSEVFGFPGSDATPAPWFDDVRVIKHRIGGPQLSTRTLDISQDSFPANGSIDVSTQAARDALDVRFDMARDVTFDWPQLASGDSVIVNVDAVIRDSEVVDVRMVWALRRNPLFEPAIRVDPARPGIDVDVVTTTDASGREIQSGAVVMDLAVTSHGHPVGDLFAADLPDEDLLYPGDVLHYYFQATDDAGRVTTLPADIGGFGQWDAVGGSAFSRTFTVRALPSIRDAAGDQPEILVLNEYARLGGEDELVLAMAQLDLHEGVDWDSYTVQDFSGWASCGIGSFAVDGPLEGRRGHGATPAQLAGYRTILVLSGDRAFGLLSDGSGTDGNDKGDDIGVLTQWKHLAGPRNTIYFGDSLVSTLVADSPVDGARYVSEVMGVDPLGLDARDRIGGQTTPLVAPTPEFELAVAGADPFYVFASCPYRRYDSIEPATSAFASHRFADADTGQPFPGLSAGVIFDRLETLDRKVDITFPFALEAVITPVARSSRASLMADVLEYLGDPRVVVDAPAAPRAASLSVWPTPFNPRTRIRFGLPVAGLHATVRVFDLRGELVRTLHDGVAATADLTIVWDGRDDRGTGVASGVYLVKAVTEGFSGTRKAVLVR